MDIKKIFNMLGISEFGIVSAKTADDLIINNNNNNNTFASKKTYECIDDILPEAKSIIVYLVPYNHGLKPENLSLYATGTDYHNVCRFISSQIISVLSASGANCISFADSGPLNERALANKAGLGILGKNHFLINKSYGTYTFIGYIITSLFLPPTKSANGHCINCGKCLKQCPGKALSINGFDESKCISYITQKKGELTDTEINLIKTGKSVWGCDICQTVCPMNQNIKLTELDHFTKDLILCIKHEYLSNREFKNKYGTRAFSWRGKSVIDRNLSILNEN